DEAQRELDSVTDSAAWKPPLQLALALDRKQYDAALALLREGALIHDLPLFALNYVAALRMSGARDEAYREATKMISGTTDSCAARAMLAGLKQERGETQAARELVAPALRAAAGPGVMPSTLRCGVLSAAAIGDAPEAAALLRQIAGDERML